MALLVCEFSYLNITNISISTCACWYDVLMTVPPKNVSLAACLNSCKENGNDEDGTSVGDARI